MRNPARWLLPEGIEENLPEEATKIERLRRDLLDLYRTWGYELVMTPLIEYLDSLLTGTGQGLDLETFKLIDQLNGRLLGIRADITPQVARIDAHSLQSDGPSRFCYLARILRTRPQGPGGNRSPLQVGAELYGHQGLDSDVEIIRLMLATLKVCGIERIHLDLGHIGIFRQLVRQAGLSTNMETDLFNMLQRKAYPEMKALLDGLELSEIKKYQFLSLVDLNGGSDILDRAHALLDGSGGGIESAIESLATVASVIEKQHTDIEVCFDLSELRGYHYHSGIVYAAYIPGRGEEIARGGRYDGIGAVFGRARPATGFSAELESLLRIGLPPKDIAESHIYAPACKDDLLEARIADLRHQRRVVIRALEGQSVGPMEMGCHQQLVWQNDEWQLMEVD